MFVRAEVTAELNSVLLHLSLCTLSTPFCAFFISRLLSSCVFCLSNTGLLPVGVTIKMAAAWHHTQATPILEKPYKVYAFWKPCVGFVAAKDRNINCAVYRNVLLVFVNAYKGQCQSVMWCRGCVVGGLCAPESTECESTVDHHGYHFTWLFKSNCNSAQNQNKQTSRSQTETSLCLCCFLRRHNKLGGNEQRANEPLSS